MATTDGFWQGCSEYGLDGSYTGYVGCDIDITERKNAEDRIRESQAALELSHREIQYLAGRLIEAQDVERARIARDLHDDVSQQLAGVSIAFSGLKQRLGEYHVSEELQQELVELQRQTLDPRTQRSPPLPRSPSDRAPTSGTGEGPHVVLRRTRACPRSDDDVCCVGGFLAITPDAALCVYRIAQEALRNVIAHSGASRADVSLIQAGDQAEISIADDGCGFDSSKGAARDKGLGLVSISERARIIGGTVSVVSGRNQGTRVQATIPVNGRVTSHAGGVTGQVA